MCTSFLSSVAHHESLTRFKYEHAPTQYVSFWIKTDFSQDKDTCYYALNVFGCVSCDVLGPLAFPEIHSERYSPPPVLINLIYSFYFLIRFYFLILFLYSFFFAALNLNCTSAISPLKSRKNGPETCCVFGGLHLKGKIVPQIRKKKSLPKKTAPC